MEPDMIGKILLGSAVVLSATGFLYTIYRGIKESKNLPNIKKERELKISELEKNLNEMSPKQRTKFIGEINPYNDQLERCLNLSKNILEYN